MSSQKGIGLLELMLSLAIIALIMIMATRYYSVVQQQQKINQLMTGISALLQAAHTAGPPYPTDAHILRGQLVTKGLLPASYNSLLTPWGGDFDIKGRGDGWTYLQLVLVVPDPVCKMVKERLKNVLLSGVGALDPVAPIYPGC